MFHTPNFWVDPWPIRFHLCECHRDLYYTLWIHSVVKSDVPWIHSKSERIASTQRVPMTCTQNWNLNCCATIQNVKNWSNSLIHLNKWNMKHLGSTQRFEIWNATKPSQVKSEVTWTHKQRWNRKPIGSTQKD